MEWEYSGLADTNINAPASGVATDAIANDVEMDIDPGDYLVIVPDTNIWIGYPELLKTLMNTDFEKVSYPTIIIPWMVMQELDLARKGRPNNGRSSDKLNNSLAARKSIAFIHDLLDSKHPRVRGQKASDAVRAQEQFKAENADDRILQCALQCVQNSHYTLVVFMTNDRNLLSKAMVESSDDIRQKLLICDTNRTVQKIKEKIDLEMGGRSIEPRVDAPVSAKTNQESSARNNRRASLTLPPLRERRPPSPRRKVSTGDMFAGKIDLSSPKRKMTRQSESMRTPPLPVRKPLKRNRQALSSTLYVQPVPNKKNQPSSPGSTTRSISKRISSRQQSDDHAPSSGTYSVAMQIPPKCDSFKEVAEFLCIIFSCILEFKMKEDFGEKLWTHSLRYKPPWTLSTALKNLIHHHFGVFSYVFGMRSKPQIESLLSLVEDYLACLGGNADAASPTNQLEDDIIELALTLVMLARTKGGGIDKKLKLDECEKVLADYLRGHKV